MALRFIYRTMTFVIDTDAIEPSIAAPVDPLLTHSGAMKTFRLEDRPDRFFWWKYITPPAIVLTIGMAFLPALMAGYVNWDDDKLIAYNDRIAAITWDNIKWMWTTSFGGHFQPLTWWSYALDYAMWGPDAFIYHLTNIQWHCLTALAFYVACRRLIWEAMGRAMDRKHHRVVIAAGVASLLFAVHPMRVESVAWIAERRDVLSGFFYVTSLWCYLRYTASRDEPDNYKTGSTIYMSRLWFVLAVVSCTVSLLAKASAMTLPLVLLIIDRYPLRRHVARAHYRLVTMRWMLLEKIPFFLLAICSGLRAVIAQEKGGALYTLDSHDRVARIAQACYGLVFYLKKTLLPLDLGPLYPIPTVDVLTGSMLGYSAVVLVVIIIIAVALRKKTPSVAAALAIYVVVVSPMLGLMQSGPQLVADRYSYLSCMGFAVLVGGGVWRVLSSSWWQQGRQRRLVASLFLVGMLTATTQATIVQSYYWTSDLELWSRGVSVSPDSAIAHTNYADALNDGLLPEEAEKHYLRALTLDPDDVVALHHYGDLKRDAGQIDLAIRLYLASLRIDPSRGRASFSLAQLLLGKNRAHQAIDVLQDTIDRHPGFTEVKTYMANVLSMHPDEDIRDGKRAIWLASSVCQLSPDNPIALMTLATALAETRQFDQAIILLKQAMVLAEKKDEARLLRELTRRLEQFQLRQPIRVSP